MILTLLLVHWILIWIVLFLHANDPMRAWTQRVLTFTLFAALVITTLYAVLFVWASAPAVTP